MTEASSFPELIDATLRREADRVFLHRRHATDRQPVTFRELGEKVDRIAAGMLASGLERGDRAALIADNRAEWLAIDLACTSVGIVDVPRGADTTQEELIAIVAHSGARFAFVDNERAAQTLLAARERLPHGFRVCSLAANAPPGITTLAELEQLGERNRGLLRRRADVAPDDLLTIVYTSGTTGDPKGVMLTQRNLLSNIRATNEVLQIRRDDVFLSVLPAWHMYERILEYIAFTIGAQLVYTDRRRIREDLAEVRPTAFAAVPRIWEMLHDAIVDRVEKLPAMQRRLLRATLSTCRRVGGRRCSAVARALHWLLDRTLLPKLRAATGGRLRLAVSGGGSLPAHVDELLIGIGIPLLNGYGLTETSPVAAVRLPCDNRPGTIGRPLPGTEIEIRCPEGRRLPQGETGVIWIRGPQVMQGYFRNPDATQRVLDEQGWFNSGDLGRCEPEGHIRITGRAKDTIVLVTGENVEPEPLEEALKTSPLIEQAVVVGQDRKTLGALLVPNFDALARQVPRSEWELRDGVLHGAAVRTVYKAEIARLIDCRNGFRPCQNVTVFQVLAEPLTAENGFLTPTLKVKRRVVHERLAPVIASAFGGA
jgi:long-chain acyl-CoA synthetase